MREWYFTSHDFSIMPHPGMAYRDGHYKTKDENANFAIELPHGMKKGWYGLEVNLPNGPGLEPRILFDLDEDYFDDYEVPLFPISCGCYGVYVYLPVESNHIRLFPHRSSIKFRLKEFTVRHLGRRSLPSRLLGCVPIANNKFRQFVPDEKTGPLPHNPKHFSYFDFETKRLVSLNSSYRQWMAKYDYSASDRKPYERKLKNPSKQPLISIIMPISNPLERDLDEAIKSVHRQIYRNWELCIAGDCSIGAGLRATLQRWSAKDPRIKITFCNQRGHISKAANTAFDMATGDYVALMDHDDILREHTLAEVAIAVNAHDKAEIIYSDEDKIDANGSRFDPYFKPDWSPDLFRSWNYLNHLTIHRAANIRAAGGWREDFEASQDFDLTLRIMEQIPPDTILHIPKVLVHRRATKSSAAHSATYKSGAFTAGKKALEEHFKRTGINAVVEQIPPYYHPVYDVPSPPPLVSLIIPTKDQKRLLETCVSSVLEKTDYSNYEILIVNNDSRDRETIDYFEEIARHEKVKVLDFPGPFNFSAINNFAVEQSAGELIALMNNDVEIISPHWLRLMAGHALRSEIGCVGAKLYYPNDRIQHAGVILGLDGVAGHGHKYFRRSHGGYFARLMLTQNVSAVTAACLVVRKEIYNEVGGLNEIDLAVAFNDVDFCLKVRERGYLNLFEPHAELVHHESISRGQENIKEKRRRFRTEVNYMKRRWGEVLYTDPYYSPHLSLKTDGFSIKQ